MKIFVVALLALTTAAVTLDAADASAPHYHSQPQRKLKGHKHHHKHHDHHHANMKFREVEVVASRAQCPRGGSVVLCSSLSDECKDDVASPGNQTCQPRDPATFLATVDAKSTGPWNKCSQSDATLPSKCLFAFECICDDYANKECYCAPPDAYRMGRGTPDGCKTSDGKTGCDAGKYCRTKGDKQECADAPYLPGLPLYAQCNAANKASGCQDGLTCKNFGSDFAMCVKK